MPANVDGMVREGLNAYRAGKKEEARALLLRAVEIDQYNEQAWLWLSAVVESPEEQRTCLENVLMINPNNERAKQGIDMLAKKGGAAAPSPSTPAPSDEDVLAGSVIKQSGDDELPSAVDWGAPPSPPTASSSSSSFYPVAEPSAQEYDSWVANLGLGAGQEAQTTEPDAATPPPTAAFSTAFLEDDEDLFSLGNDAVFSSDSVPSAPTSGATPPPPSKPPAAKVMSPPPKTSPPSKRSDSLLDELDEDDDFISELDEDYDEAELGKLDPEEMFRYIPKEIKATRLPGTRERYPIPVLIGLIVALLLNIGAVIFLISQLGAASG